MFVCFLISTPCPWSYRAGNNLLADEFPAPKRGPGTGGYLEVEVQCRDSPDRITEGAFLPSAGAGSLSAFLFLHCISKEVFTF